MNAYSTLAQKYNNTPQTEQDPSRSDQVKNNAGGFTFSLTPLQQFQRFLILGSNSSTYYVHKDQLTKENHDNTIKLFSSDQYAEALDLLLDVSLKGRAPKLSPTLFALALAFASINKECKKKAVEIFPQIVRTQSHLFEFISYVRNFRGMGRLLKDAIANWYQDKNVNDLAYQMIKYRNRNGYTTRDVLRLVKPKPTCGLRSDLYAFGANKHRETSIGVIEAFKQLQSLEKPNLNLITEHNLPREALPTQWLNYPEVWESMLPTMPLTALIRNLGKMASLNMLTEFSNNAKIIIDKLSDVNYLRRSRIHPFNILLALSTYQFGHGVKGALYWNVNQQIVQALDAAFYKAFENIIPANKRMMLALDISGSMNHCIMGSHLFASQASAAMSLITLKTEPQCIIKGFSHDLIDLKINANDNIESAMKKTRFPFGPTNCAQPMLWAMDNKIPVDGFVIYTDNETWYGAIHPHQALKQYRQKMGIDAKLVVVGMISTNFTIADPLDPGMMDVVGFDSSAPEVISSFMRGNGAH